MGVSWTSGGRAYAARDNEELVITAVDATVTGGNPLGVYIELTSETTPGNLTCRLVDSDTDVTFKILSTGFYPLSVYTARTSSTGITSLVALY